MIDYVEIRRKEDRELIGIIDTAKSIIWSSSYYGIGSFEIYVAATSENAEMLKDGNYITRSDNFECGRINHVETTEDDESGRMIVASGFFIKEILNQRIAYYPTLTGTGLNYVWSCSASVLSGNVEKAVRKLIYDNAIYPYRERPLRGESTTTVVVYPERIIPEIYWTDDDLSNLTETIVIDATSDTEEAADKQVTYKYLGDYTNSVLQEYGLGSKMWLDRSNLLFRYKVYKGEDRSRDSTTHEPIIFSTEFDNLRSSQYISDSSNLKTTAIIGGEGEGTDRKCALVNDWLSGLERREVFVDASSIMSEESDTIESYRKKLEAQGKQTIANSQIIETFDGEIDVANSQYEYLTDYNLGDIVTIEDKEIGKYINARILVVTEVQDDDGYNIKVEYGN